MSLKIPLTPTQLGGRKSRKHKRGGSEVKANNNEYDALGGRRKHKKSKKRRGGNDAEYIPEEETRPIVNPEMRPTIDDIETAYRENHDDTSVELLKVLLLDCNYYTDAEQGEVEELKRRLLDFLKDEISQLSRTTSLLHNSPTSSPNEMRGGDEAEQIPFTREAANESEFRVLRESEILDKLQRQISQLFTTLMRILLLDVDYYTESEKEEAETLKASTIDKIKNIINVGRGGRRRKSRKRRRGKNKSRRKHR
jgi:hypothetical protein